MKVPFRKADGSTVPARPFVVAGSVLALMVAPLALAQEGEPVRGQAAAGEGDPILGGERNPGGNQTRELSEETQIIAETGQGTYGTRQSNKGAGGGAIYGCRSTRNAGSVIDPAVNTPCLRVNNLNSGLAFQMDTNGTLGGTIVVGTGGDNAKPFVTNATGVATGLNADEVDGMSADQIIQAAGGQGGQGPQGPAGPQGEPGEPADSISTFDTYFEALDGDGSEVTIAENGPLRYFARCTVGSEGDGTDDRIEVFVESSTDEAFEEDSGRLAPGEEVLVYDNTSAPQTPSYDNDIDDGSSIAAEGTTGSYIGIDGETIGLGLNVFGNDCVVAGSAFFADGEVAGEPTPDDGGGGVE